MKITAYFVFMVLVLTAIGFGVGSVELLIWTGILVAGVTVLVRRYRQARLGVG